MQPEGFHLPYTPIFFMKTQPFIFVAAAENEDSGG